MFARLYNGRFGASRSSAATSAMWLSPICFKLSAKSGVRSLSLLLPLICLEGVTVVPLDAGPPRIVRAAKVVRCLCHTHKNNNKSEMVQKLQFCIRTWLLSLTVLASAPLLLFAIYSIDNLRQAERAVPDAQPFWYAKLAGQ